MDPVIDALEKQQELLEKKVEEHARLLYGDPTIGFPGLREDVRVNRELINGLIRKQEREEDERRGMKRILGYTGVTSLLTLLTVMGTLIAIWQGVFGG